MIDSSWALKADSKFDKIWQQVAPYTMTSPERGFALWQAINYILDNNIRGAFVECGVWRGGSALLMALTLRARAASREIFLFDTFEGMTAPSLADEDHMGTSAAELLAGSHGADLATLVEACASLDDVKRVLHGVGYDPRLLRYIIGDVRETLRKTQTLDIALLRLDTDFYDSTLEELEQLYPRVNLGGVVIIDDYGHWRGARKAVDEFFGKPHNSANKPLLWALDYTGRGFVKQHPARKIEVERYDYVPPGMVDPKLLHLFPFAKAKNAWAVKWPYLRPHVPHIFRCDERNKAPFQIGNASYEEAVCLHTIALQFKGKRGLEIGTHFGWTSAHLCAAQLEMDLIDPAFSNPERVQAIADVTDRIAGPTPRMWDLFSPEGIEEARAAKPDPWSFIFIDGDHDGDAPEKDARAAISQCADDAVVMFHDMTSPYVARGLNVFRDAGWNVGLFNTMQVLGIAWRGNVTIPNHIQDPSIPQLYFEHLRGYRLLIG